MTHVPIGSIVQQVLDQARAWHLVLGEPTDLCSRLVCDALEARGHATHLITQPLAHPARFGWSFDTDRSASSLALDGQPPMRDDQIAGVLVRGAGWIDPAGWQVSDLEYVQAETHAALLAWLWSLSCPVVNRYPPASWYRPTAPLIAWHAHLRRSGLPTLATVVTNVERDARAFSHRLAADGVEGVVYGPLTGDAHYLVTNEEDWQGVTALQRVSPVCLSAPHGEALRASVVGDQVIWDGEPSPDAAALEAGLRRFADRTSLDHIEVAVAPAASGMCVVAVDVHPRLEHLGDAARMRVVDAIVGLLTTKARPSGSLA